MSATQINILIIDDLHPCFFEQQGLQNFKITYLPEIKAEDVPMALVNQQVLVVRSKVTVNSSICKFANALQLVARAGSGVDNLDIEWLDSKGISYFNTPEANSQAVAEQTLGMLLSLMSNITKSDREVREIKWDREGNRGDELQGKIVGIIGYGHTGSRFAKLLQGFDVKVLAYDKYKSGFSEGHVIESEMDNLFNEADILSLHVPLTKETKHLVNNNFIKGFKKPFRLLNLSRGEIHRTTDVIESIKNKKIIGFAADVLENERINQLNNIELKLFDQLRSFSNVVLTPHIGGWTHQSYRNISMIMSLKILDFFDNSAHLERGFKEAQKFP